MTSPGQFGMPQEGPRVVGTLLMITKIHNVGSNWKLREYKFYNKKILKINNRNRITDINMVLVTC